jgi:hypothetical protein
MRNWSQGIAFIPTLSASSEVTFAARQRLICHGVPHRHRPIVRPVTKRFPYTIHRACFKQRLPHSDRPPESSPSDETRDPTTTRHKLGRPTRQRRRPTQPNPKFRVRLASVRKHSPVWKSTRERPSPSGILRASHHLEAKRRGSQCSYASSAR